MTLLSFRTASGELRPIQADRAGRSRLARLGDLHLLALRHELGAEPGSPERVIREGRTRRIAQARREEQAFLHSADSLFPPRLTCPGCGQTACAWEPQCGDLHR